VIETSHPFPAKTNVEFTEVLSPTEVRVRVWERGVGETQACGTGACAVAVAASLRGLTGRNVTVNMPGGPLEIEWTDQTVLMTGPVEEVRAFLFGTALRVARRVSRNEKRWVLEDDMDFRNGQVARPEELADQRRAVDLMGRILANMDHDLKTVFILAELEGQTMPQVSSLLEIPLGTATSRLRRAREAFRAAVAAFEASIPGGVKP
jgi:hypothetical protein